jgi:Mce-associated membrane protein
MNAVAALRAMPVRRRIVGGVLVVALVVLSVIAVLGFIGPPESGRGDDRERQQVQVATADAVTALMTFRPDTLTAAQQTVGDRLTGRLLLEFRSQGPGVVLPTAVESGAQMTAQVLATGVADMDDSSARVLVFVNQDITLPTAQPQQQVVAVTRWADMRKVDGNWLLAGLQPVGPG